MIFSLRKGHCSLKNTHGKNGPCGFNIMQMLQRATNSPPGRPATKACRKTLHLTTN